MVIDLNKKPVCEPQTYIIDKYIEVRLETNGHTLIYIDDKPFRQCKYLLINIPEREFNDAIEYSNTIDDLSNKYSKTHETTKRIKDKPVIPYEQEFWAHCSNLQVFSENGYNPATLHSNLSMPILKLLACKDVKIFHNLLFQLDDLVNQYHTTERKVMLLNTYKSVLTKATECYGITHDDLECTGILQAFYVNKYMEHFLNIYGYMCWACETRKSNKIESVVHEIFHSCFNAEPDILNARVCETCYDNGFPYEHGYEYCGSCGRIVPYDDTVYHENWDSSMCIQCLQEMYLTDGMDYFADTTVMTLVLNDTDLLQHDFKDFGIIYKNEDRAERRFDKLKESWKVIVILEHGTREPYKFWLKPLDKRT